MVLKLRLEPAIRPGTTAALARDGATGRYARKKVWVGPRTATRRREAEDMASPSRVRVESCKLSAVGGQLGEEEAALVVTGFWVD